MQYLGQMEPWSTGEPTHLRFYSGRIWQHLPCFQNLFVRNWSF